MRIRHLVLIVASAVFVAACGSSSSTPTTVAPTSPSSVPSTEPTPDSVPVDRPSLVATHSVLGAIVGDLVGDAADVTVLIPNGVDPHGWEASARDVETINNASLVVANGLNLEESLESILETAEAPVFFATDHITPLTSSDSHDHAHEGDAKAEEDHAHDHAHEGEATTEEDHAHDHSHEGGDPHFWTDPGSVAEVVEHLGEELSTIGLDVTTRAETMIADLIALDGEVSELLSAIPVEKRVLITGHVSMAYFAAHYGFELLGSVVPNLSTSAEASAANLAELKETIAAEGMSVIFGEVGSPDDVVTALADETGVRVVVLPTHLVPEEGTYRSFLLALASQVRDALTA